MDSIDEVNLATSILEKLNENETSDSEATQDIYFENFDKNHFLCKLCDRKISKSFHIKHIEYHSYEGINISLEIKYLCKYCLDYFTSLDKFEHHLLEHKRSKLYKCKFCDQHFTEKNKLNLHNRIHIDEKPFECNHCHKKFRMKYMLVVHMRVHTGERPFQCDQCKKSFSQKSTLINHVRIHSGIKPYECKICNKKFNVNSHLKLHLKKHNAPPCCPKCNKGDLNDK